MYVCTVCVYVCMCVYKYVYISIYIFFQNCTRDFSLLQKIRFYNTELKTAPFGFVNALQLPQQSNISIEIWVQRNKFSFSLIYHSFVTTAKVAFRWNVASMKYKQINVFLQNRNGLISSLVWVLKFRILV